MSTLPISAQEIVFKTFPGQAFAELKPAAKFIGYAYQTARNLISEGNFPLRTVKIGKKRLIPISELISFVQKKNEEAGEGDAK